MKIIAEELGRVLDLVPIEELRPAGGIYLPNFIQQITERYKFVAGPKDIVEAVAQGVKFQHGTFIVDDNSVVVRELGVYSDGMVVEAHDTRTADIILDDFLRWATETYKLRERQTPPRRTYSSVVIFEFEHGVEAALGKLNQISRMLSESMRSAYGWNYEFNLNRLAFSADPTTLPNFRNTLFFIERRVQSPYTSNRYFSGAPFQTEQHWQLLETIERELLA